MLQLYFHPSPNPMKVALFLEEAGLPYELVAVDTRKGEQHLPSFRAINTVMAQSSSIEPSDFAQRVITRRKVSRYSSMRSGAMNGGRPNAKRYAR